MKVTVKPEGELTDVPFGRLLGALFVERATGTLTLTWNTMGKTFWLQNGTVLAVDSTVEGEHVLDFLLPQHADPLVSYYDAWRQQPLPEVLSLCLNRLHIPADDIQKALITAVHQNAAHALLWSAGTYRWVAGSIPTILIRADIAIPLVLWKALQTLRDEAVLMRQVGFLPPRLPRRNARFYQEGLQLDLTPQDFYFIEQMDGRTLLDRAVQVTRIDRARALRLLSLMVLCGWLEAEPPSPKPTQPEPPIAPTPPTPSEEERFREKVVNFYTQMGRLSPEQILMVTNRTTRSELEATVQRLRREYDPAVCMRNPALRDLREIVLRIRETIDQAYAALRDRVPETSPSETGDASPIDVHWVQYWKLRGRSPRATPPSQPESRPASLSQERIVQILYNRALEYIQVGNNWQAVQTLEQLIQLRPNVAEYYFLLGAVYESHPRLHAKAAQAYARAVELDPNNARYVAHLALLLYQDGQYHRACRYLERLQQMDPSNQRVRKLLQEARRRMHKE